MNQQEEEIKNNIEKILTSAKFIKAGTKLDMNTAFTIDLGLDSLDKLESSMAIEDGLNIKFPKDRFAGDVETIGDAVRLVIEHS